MLLLKAKTLVLAATILIVELQGCGQHAKIADLTRDPGRYHDKDVTVSGKVTDSYGLLGTGAYQVDDGSGTIWVISEQAGVPTQGAHVEVTGRLAEGGSFGGRSLGLVLRETRRKR
jgi:hypothetical protein